MMVYESDEQDEFSVLLFIYDMTKGLAGQLSPLILGTQIGGIWHTGIVAYGREYFFGGSGIESCTPKGTMLGEPDRILDLGKTEIPYSIFLEYILSLGTGTFCQGSYNLLSHNCNNFSNEVSTFLTGNNIPAYILNLPKDIMNTPLGQSMLPLLESMTPRVAGSGGITFGALLDEASASSNRNARCENVNRTNPAAPTLKAKNSSSSTDGAGESEASQIQQQSLTEKEENDTGTPLNIVKDISEQKNKVESTFDSSSAGPDKSTKMSASTDTNGVPAVERSDSVENDEDNGFAQKIKERRANRIQPIIYSDVEAVGTFEAVEKHVADLLSEDEKLSLQELKDFVISDEGAWALGAQHLQLIGRVVYDRNIPPEIRLSMLKFLQATALKEDVILLLHMDRRDHVLMNYVGEFDTMTPEEQEGIARMICNLFDPPSASDWLLYISEWQLNNQSWSNCRVTTKVAVNSLLSDRPKLQEIGIAIMYNLGTKEVFEETATELATAVLQYLQNDMTEENAYRLLSALLKFMSISQDGVALVKMLGPDLSIFRSKGERVEKLVQQILKKTASSSFGSDE